MSSRARNFRHAMERDEGFQFTRAGGCSPPGVRCDGKVGYSKQSNLACPNLTNRQTDARLIGPERLRKSAINMKSCGPRNISCVWKIGNLHRAEASTLKKYAGSSVTRCLSASGLKSPFVRPSAAILSLPFPLWLCRVLNSEKVSFGVLPPSPSLFAAAAGQTTRIRSSNCNMCQTALNLEPQSPLSVTRFWCFYRPA